MTVDENRVFDGSAVWQPFMQEVFRNGALLKDHSFSEVRKNAD
jgi:hypothetical protein